ncbi:hypothetical protein [Ponticoccus sp. (in: a-proteobacteria)]|uniref:hypothetical protein n=1 Tax=Ponticoccus sp. (in: a-proteobacteria) TaxID=1925025 RepID=UPI003AB350ED
MFTVTPIGSCRITTPLRMGQATHGVRLNLTRSYGYCHSPAEAVQMARFLRGEAEIPADLWPLVCRSHDRETLGAQPPEMSDLYLVEIASAKELTVDGVSIQLNYLRSAFPEFLSDSTRAAAFWDLADAGDEPATAAFLDSAWSATAEQRAQSKLLARIRRSLVTRDSLRADLQTLASLLPDLLVVTHVNAVKPDGLPIRSRAGLIDMVAEECAALGLPCCNPTELMVEFGQPRAIEDDSTSLAHFTEAFARALMAEWMRTTIAPRTEALTATRPEPFVAQVEAAIERGDLNDACTRLARVSDRFPAARAALDALRADRALAQSDLGDAGADPVAWMRRAAALGCFDGAAALLDRRDDLPCDLLTDLALAAHEAGALPQAARLACAALRQTPQARRPATVLAGLVQDHALSLAGRLDPALIARVQEALMPEGIARALRRPAPCLPTLIAADLPGATLARIAGQAGVAAAPAVAHWRKAQGPGRIRDAALNAVIEAWLAEALALDTARDRAQALARLAQTDPRNAALRHALREARTDLVTRIRGLGKAGDLPALEALGAEVTALPDTRAEFDLWRARLLLARGRTAEAAEAGLAATRAMPDRLTLWVLVMRAARRARDEALALQAAGRVLSLADDNPRLAAEALRLRDALPACA